MSKWLVAQDFRCFDQNNFQIANVVVSHGLKNPRTSWFNAIRKGDKVAYLIVPNWQIAGLFEVVSDPKYNEDHPIYGECLYYDIVPIKLHQEEKYLDIWKLSRNGEDKFEVFPHGLSKESFPASRICVELSDSDFSKIELFLGKKEYQKELLLDKDVTGAMSALLGFYGDRATSFSSLFVAAIFGTVTLSAIIQNIKIGPIAIAFSIIPFVFFVGAGFYTLQKYFSYVDIAEKIKSYGLEVPYYQQLRDFHVTEWSDIKGTYTTDGLSNYLARKSRKISENPIRKQILDKRHALISMYVVAMIIIGIIVYVSALYN